MFQTNPCNNTRLALEKCKQDLEALYEDKVHVDSSPLATVLLLPELAVI